MAREGVNAFLQQTTTSLIEGAGTLLEDVPEAEGVYKLRSSQATQGASHQQKAVPNSALLSFKGALQFPRLESEDRHRPNKPAPAPSLIWKITAGPSAGSRIAAVVFEPF